jgi:hypothetical protein
MSIQIVQTGQNVFALDLKILYKYRTWKEKNHKDLLRKGVVYFAAPDSFEDTFDCNIPEVFPEGEKLFQMFYKKSIEINPNFTKKQHTEFATYWCKHSPIANVAERDKLLEFFRKEFSDRHGILSLCKTPNNDAMWEKYGDNYNGYCVGFDASVLANYCSGGGEVHYINGIPLIDFMNDSNEIQIEKQIFSKSQVWSFEDEYRFLKIGKNVLTNQERIVLLPQESIREVYLGKNMSKNDRIEVMEIVQARYSNAIIFE